MARVIIIAKARELMLIPGPRNSLTFGNEGILLLIQINIEKEVDF